MARIRGRLLAAGFSVLLVGVSPCVAVDAPPPDLSDLRDAVKAANKRGENVSEVAKALDVLEKAIAKGWNYPAIGKAILPSPELAALRDAVEAAGKKGENVSGILKELEALEKEMTGRVQDRTKPVPPVDPPIPTRPQPVPQFRVIPNRPPVEQPKKPSDPPIRANARMNADITANLQRAEELFRRVAEQRKKDPFNQDAVIKYADAEQSLIRARAAAEKQGK